MAMIPEVEIWYEDGGKEWIQIYIPTLDEMIKEKKSKQGVYAVLVDGMYAYIGETGKKENRSIENRLCEHAYHLATNPKCYFGIPSHEIVNKDATLSVMLLVEEKDLTLRKEKEESCIEELKPYTQSTNYPKYSKKNYKGIDLCIYRKFRHQAYTEARKVNI